MPIITFLLDGQVLHRVSVPPMFTNTTDLWPLRNDHSTPDSAASNNDLDVRNTSDEAEPETEKYVAFLGPTV